MPAINVPSATTATRRVPPLSGAPQPACRERWRCSAKPAPCTRPDTDVIDQDQLERYTQLCLAKTYLTRFLRPQANLARATATMRKVRAMPSVFQEDTGHAATQQAQLTIMPAACTGRLTRDHHRGGDDHGTAVRIVSESMSTFSDRNDKTRHGGPSRHRNTTCSRQLVAADIGRRGCGEISCHD